MSGAAGEARALTREGRSLERLASGAGLFAFAAIAIGSVVGAVGYSGTAQEPYSPLNHWISELGQEGVAAHAALFNLALIAGGLAFVVFVAGLALTSRSRLRWAFGPIGMVAGLGGAAVGVFPMNDSTHHVLAAFTFFNLGWIFVGLASVSFVLDHRATFPRWLAVVGAASVAAFIAFLVSLQTDAFARQRMATSGAIVGRPAVWLPAILEWATLLGIVVWVLLTALVWWRRLARPVEAAQ